MAFSTRPAPKLALPMPKRTPSLATNTDRHTLYERAVQAVDAEIDFIDDAFRTLRKRRARRLREDFCGTANTSAEWVRRRSTNSAVGLDLDQPTLDWGRERHIAKLTPSQQSRLTLLRRNVLRPGAGASGVDCILAMNFSWWIFRERATLKRYFSSVRRSLVRDGVFFLDIYGGWEAQREQIERRPIHGGHRSKRGFTYIWEQAEFDPVNNRTQCHISFRLRDGSRMPRVFSYDWRLWSIPETRDLLHEVGFKRVTIYWEGDDGKGGGNGEFKPAKTGECCATFIAYIAAEK